MKIMVRWIQRLVRQQGNPRRVFSKYRKCIVKVILAVEVGKIRGPEFLGFRTLLLDPVRNLGEDLPASLPLMEVLRTTDGNLTFSIRPVARTEQVPGCAFLNDGRIVDELDVAVRFQGVWRTGLLRERNAAG